MKLLKLFLILLSLSFFVTAVFFVLNSKNIFIAIYFVINGIILFAAALFERRYKTKSEAGPGFKPTGEKFVDEKGKTVEVYYNSKTGERRYL